MEYDFEDSFFTSVIYKLDRPVLKIIVRPKCGEEVDFKHEVIEYKGSKCYIKEK